MSDENVNEKGQEKNKSESVKRKLDESDDDDDIFEYQSKCIRTGSKIANAKTENPSPASSKKQRGTSTTTQKKKAAVTKKRTQQKKKKKSPLVMITDDEPQKQKKNGTVLVRNSPEICPDDSSECSSNANRQCSVQPGFRTPRKATESPFTCIRTPASSKGKTITPHKKQKLKTPNKSQKKKNMNPGPSGTFATLTPLKTPKNERFCPSCQMPFRCLVRQSANWHMTECMEVSRTPLKECPGGLDCSATIPGHYRKFRHQILANVRAGLDVVRPVDGDDATSRNDSVVQTVSDDLPSSDDTTDPHEPLLMRFSKDRPSRKLDFGVTKLEIVDNETEIVDTETEIDDNGTEIVDTETEIVDNESERASSPDDIFASCDSDNEESSNHSEVLESGLSDIFGGSLNGESSVKYNPDYSENSDPNPDLITDANSNAICRIADVRTLNRFESQNETETETENSPPAIEVLGESRDRKMTSLKSATSGCKQQSTLHSFFHVPETYKAPTAVKDRKGRAAKKTTIKTEKTEKAEKEEEQQIPETLKNCPFYKRIPGTKFTVDAFRYGSIPDCEAYFLSHFHYDHYGGLTKHFKHKIYCSKVTGNLVCRNIRVQESYVHRLPMNEEVFVNGASVTLLDANHCPGAVMFLYRLKDGRTMLHTGDFRGSEAMESYPQLIGARIHQLYLDTTYCNENYVFPPQQDMISLAVDIATKAVRQNPRTLFVCGTYTIGKEKIFLAIADALNVKFCVTKNKKTILECLEDPNVEARMTLSWQQAQVHVLKMMQLKLHILLNHLKQYSDQYDQLVAFEPTGWTHSDKKTDVYKPKAQREFVKIYGIPYSEHSSYSEMKRFVQFVNPDRILPTVNNGTAEGRQKMVRIFEEWNLEREEMEKAKE